MKKQRITKLLGGVLFLVLLALPASMRAQFAFDRQETQELAAFMKQTATDGKTNAEALGIDINASGFSWEDMNTWKNASGIAYTKYPDNNNVYTPWGAIFKPEAPYNGKLLKIVWSNKYGPEKNCTPTNAQLEKLQGSLKLTKCLMTNFHMGFTSIEKLALEMQLGAGTGDGVTEKWIDCYIKVVDNTKLKELDLSNSLGHLRQIEVYRNALEVLKLDNVCQEYFMAGENKDIKLYYFMGWVANIEKNRFSFSTLPENPCREGEVFGSWDGNEGKVYGGYKDQYLKDNEGNGGMPIGEKDTDGSYYVLANEPIDLSDEYQPKGAVTTFTWRDAETGDEVTPSRERNGMFFFDKSFAGKILACEMRNSDFPLLILNTVDVVVKESPTSVNQTPNDETKVSMNENNLIIKSKDEVNRVTIYSLAGTSVMDVVNPANIMDVSTLPAGAYIVRIFTSDANKTVKVVK